VRRDDVQQVPDRSQSRVCVVLDCDEVSQSQASRRLILYSHSPTQAVIMFTTWRKLSHNRQQLVNYIPG
jgi:hypothetical protein